VLIEMNSSLDLDDQVDRLDGLYLGDGLYWM